MRASTSYSEGRPLHHRAEGETTMQAITPSTTLSAIRNEALKRRRAND
jgi:hypothetical protein